MKCKKCGTEITKGDVFCSNCGQKVGLVKECPKCHVSVGDNDVYCPECGTRIQYDNKIEEGNVNNSINEIKNNTEVVNPVNTPKNNTKLIIIIAIAAVVFIGAAVTGFFIFIKKDSSPTTKENVVVTNNETNKQSQTQTPAKTNSDSSTISVTVGDKTDSAKETTATYIVLRDGIRLRKCGDQTCEAVDYNSLPNDIKSIVRKGNDGIYLDTNDIITVSEVVESGSSTWVKLADGVWACSIYNGETWITKK